MLEQALAVLGPEALLERARAETALAASGERGRAAEVFDLAAPPAATPPGPAELPTHPTSDENADR